MKVESLDESFEIDVKRFYAPIILCAECPECGRECSRDLRDNGLSYPRLNEPMEVWFRCLPGVGDGRDEHEFARTVVLRLSVEAVPDAAS